MEYPNIHNNNVMTSSPSFNELFDENGQMKDENFLLLQQPSSQQQQRHEQQQLDCSSNDHGMMNLQEMTDANNNDQIIISKGPLLSSQYSNSNHHFHSQAAPQSVNYNSNNSSNVNHHNNNHHNIIYHHNNIMYQSPPSQPPALPQQTHDMLDDQDDSLLSHLSLENISLKQMSSSSTTSSCLILPPPPPLYTGGLYSTQNNAIATVNAISSKSQSLLCKSSTSSSSSSSVSLFSSVPLDALHSIAGFLTIEEWCNVGLTSKEALGVCRNVLRKVKMHGFKCALEVISAWEIGEHSDAKELAALYIQNGVPIYPVPFGHAYHTLDWRMKVEAKDIESKNNNNTTSPTTTSGSINNNTNSENHNEEDDTTPNNSPIGSTTATTTMSSTSKSSLPVLKEVTKVDQFYAEQINFRATGNNTRLGNDPSLTYLEQKGIFWKNVHSSTKSPNRSSRNNIISTRHHHRGRENVNEVELFAFMDDDDDDDNDANFNRFAGRGHFVDIPEHIMDRPQNPIRLPFDVDQGRNLSLSPPTLSNSSSLESIQRNHNATRVKGLKIPVRCHRHLVSRHYARYTIINDNRGDMKSSDISMSADFFHPIGQKKNVQKSSTLFDVNFNESPKRDSLFPVRNNRSPSRTTDHDIISKLDVQMYSFDTESFINDSTKRYYVNLNRGNTQLSSLNEVVLHYENLLQSYLQINDYYNFNECLLDFWDVFFTETAMVHFYDKTTPVPRMSYKQLFLSRPCPKAFGTIQCEIERVRIQPKHKGVNVTGRIFPTYEYRLFIRDRRHTQQIDSHLASDNDQSLRLDSVLMVAKHKSRNQSGQTHSHLVAGKRGVNNYHFYMPRQEDIDEHLQAVNESVDSKNLDSGYRQKEVPGSNFELGRLQSNFIGTEFQIFCPSTEQITSMKGNNEQNSQDVDHPEINDNATNGTHQTKKLSFKFRHSFGKNRHGTDSDLIHGKRKGRITPWSSLAKNLSRDKEDIENSMQTCDNEIGAITYTANLLGNRPRVMDVCVPKIDEANGLPMQISSSNEGTDDDSILNKLRSFSQQQQDDAFVADRLGELGLMSLQNRPPWWNVELGAFVLNFGGRVSVASVKNFQLCDRYDHDNIMLQFGRIEGRHSFTMDFSYPLSPLQAFAISVSSLQSKISFA